MNEWDRQKQTDWAQVLGRYEPHWQTAYDEMVRTRSARAAPRREMTAGDLGLPCDCDRIDCPPCHAAWLRKQHSNAPYAFWLGKDKPNPLDGTRLWDNS